MVNGYEKAVTPTYIVNTELNKRFLTMKSCSRLHAWAVCTWRLSKYWHLDVTHFTRVARTWRMDEFWQLNENNMLYIWHSTSIFRVWSNFLIDYYRFVSLSPSYIFVIVISRKWKVFTLITVLAMISLQSKLSHQRKVIKPRYIRPRDWFLLK